MSKNRLLYLWQKTWEFASAGPSEQFTAVNLHRGLTAVEWHRTPGPTATALNASLNLQESNGMPRSAQTSKSGLKNGVMELFREEDVKRAWTAVRRVVSVPLVEPSPTTLSSRTEARSPSAGSWPAEPWEHMLHELSAAVPDAHAALGRDPVGVQGGTVCGAERGQCTAHDSSAYSEGLAGQSSCGGPCASCAQLAADQPEVGSSTG